LSAALNNLYLRAALVIHSTPANSNLHHPNYNNNSPNTKNPQKRKIQTHTTTRSKTKNKKRFTLKSLLHACNSCTIKFSFNNFPVESTCRTANILAIQPFIILNSINRISYINIKLRHNKHSSSYGGNLGMVKHRHTLIHKQKTNCPANNNSINHFSPHLSRSLLSG
jgi:hypothetical protein